MRVLIVEDIADTRRWLVGIVEQAFPGARVTLAETLRQARALLDPPHELALLDLGLPDGSGFDLLRQLRDANSPTLCVVTTVMGDDASVVGALSAGAEGYLLKENPAALMVHQLRQIHLGLPPLSPSVARRIMEHFSRTGPVSRPERRLTGRETEVLTLISRGLRNTEVGCELGLAASTVASYIKSIYRKLGISSRAEAAWHATQMGLNRGGIRPPKT